MTNKNPEDFLSRYVVHTYLVLYWEIPIYEIWSIMQYPRVVKVITRVVLGLSRVAEGHE